MAEFPYTVSVEHQAAGGQERLAVYLIRPAPMDTRSQLVAERQKAWVTQWAAEKNSHMATDPDWLAHLDYEKQASDTATAQQEAARQCELAAAQADQLLRAGKDPSEPEKAEVEARELSHRLDGRVDRLTRFASEARQRSQATLDARFQVWAAAKLVETKDAECKIDEAVRQALLPLVDAVRVAKAAALHLHEIRSISGGYLPGCAPAKPAPPKPASLKPGASLRVITADSRAS